MTTSRKKAAAYATIFREVVFMMYEKANLSEGHGIKCVMLIIRQIYCFAGTFGGL